MAPFKSDFLRNISKHLAQEKMLKKDSLGYFVFVSLDYISNLFGIDFQMRYQSTSETKAAVVVLIPTTILPYLRAHMLGSLHF